MPYFKIQINSIMTSYKILLCKQSQSRDSFYEMHNRCYVATIFLSWCPAPNHSVIF